MWAAAHFFEQTHPSLHLVSVGHAAAVGARLASLYGERVTAIDDTRKKTLGELRNIAVERVPVGGVWVQVDDDDVRNPSLFATQLDHLRKYACDCVTIHGQVHYDARRNASAVFPRSKVSTSYRGIAGSVMVLKKSTHPVYPLLHRHEDSVFLRQMVTSTKVCVWSGPPEWYIRVYKGYNHASDTRSSSRKVLTREEPNVWTTPLPQSAIRAIRALISPPYTTYMINPSSDSLIDAQPTTFVRPQTGIVNRHTVLNPVKVAIHESHLVALRTFLNGVAKTALVLESDVTVLDRFKIYDVLQHAPRGWQYINLGRCLMRDCANLNVSFLNRIGLCRHAYLVTRTGAQYLLGRSSDTHSISGDKLWKNVANSHMYSVPKLVHQDASIKSSYRIDHSDPECASEQLKVECPRQASANWTFCAVENSKCTCGGYVRFGCRDQWSDAILRRRGVHCSAHTFGDSMPNVKKICQCRLTF